MVRYPDKITIYEPTGDTYSPYGDQEYDEVYSGKCRCYIHNRRAIGERVVGQNEFQVVIPNATMQEIGENWKVVVDMHGGDMNYVGYVTYFSRYEKVCYIDFQMIKDNQIEGDDE